MNSTANHQVLARKWRPRSFATLVGQEHVVRALENALTQQRLHHAYLLTGTRGVGKTTIARILAKSLNCEQGITATPCGNCSPCQQIDAGRFADLLEIDAASNTGIDNIREVLENAHYAPTQGRFKVYIIDETHMLSKPAFNAMLKTLEEPPGHVKFILATTDPQKVPVTVLSRCLQFALRRISAAQVGGHLRTVLEAETIPFEPPALGLLGQAAAGSMRDALSLLDQAIAHGAGQVREADVREMLGAVDTRYLHTLLQHLAASDGAALIAEAEQIAARGMGGDTALAELAALLHQLALYQTVPATLEKDAPEHDSFIRLATTLSPETVQLYYQIALHGRRDLPLAPDEFAGFSMTLLRMLAFTPVTQALGAANTQPAMGPPVPAASPVSTAGKALGKSSEREVTSPMHPANTLPAPVPKRPPLPPADTETSACRPPEAPTRQASAQSEPAPHPTARQHPSESGAPVADVPAAGVSTAGVAEGKWNNDDWISWARTLSGGQAAMLAQRARLQAHLPQAQLGGAAVVDAESWTLAVAESDRMLAGRDYVTRLEEMLAAHLTRPVRLRVEIIAGEALAETPLARRQQEREAQQQAARQALAQDPTVQALLTHFGGEIVLDSERLLVASGMASGQT